MLEQNCVAMWFLDAKLWEAYLNSSGCVVVEIPVSVVKLFHRGGC